MPGGSVTWAAPALLGAPRTGLAHWDFANATRRLYSLYCSDKGQEAGQVEPRRTGGNKRQQDAPHCAWWRATRVSHLCMPGHVAIAPLQPTITWHFSYSCRSCSHFQGAYLPVYDLGDSGGGSSGRQPAAGQSRHKYRTVIPGISAAAYELWCCLRAEQSCAGAAPVPPPATHHVLRRHSFSGISR